MSKSKVRGGAKAHRKKVAARNQIIKSGYKNAAKEAWNKFEEWKQNNEDKNNQSFSGPTGIK